jgi:hypothetical protein
VLLAVVVATAGVPGAAPERHVVILSIDGLRPEFYLDASFGATELRALVAAGSMARTAEGVFPTVTYPNHASIVTGVRPVRHGVAFNVLFDPTGERGRWYEEAADLKSPPIWEWARAAGLRTASVAWPATLGARIDLLVPERDYFARRDPLPLLQAAVAPDLFERLRVTPSAEIFRQPILWDGFLTATAAAMIRQARPRLLLLHLVQADHFQHRGGREGADVRPAVARLDAHVATLRRALREAAIAERTAVIVTGDHGFQDAGRLVYPNQVLVRAGLRSCPPSGAWRATVHTASGGAAVFVKPGDEEARQRAEIALRRAAGNRYTVLTRAQLDELGAMPGAALGLEAAAGFMIGGACGRGLEGASGGGTHGFLPSRPTMATGFIAAGAGIRSGVTLDRVRLIDVAPTAARLLGLTPPPLDGRPLEEILE